MIRFTFNSNWTHSFNYGVYPSTILVGTIIAVLITPILMIGTLVLIGIIRTVFTESVMPILIGVIMVCIVISYIINHYRTNIGTDVSKEIR